MDLKYLSSNKDVESLWSYWLLIRGVLVNVDNMLEVRVITAINRWTTGWYGSQSFTMLKMYSPVVFLSIFSSIIPVYIPTFTLSISNHIFSAESFWLSLLLHYFLLTCYWSYRHVSLVWKLGLTHNNSWVYIDNDWPRYLKRHLKNPDINVSIIGSLYLSFQCPSKNVHYLYYIIHLAIGLYHQISVH